MKSTAAALGLAFSSLALFACPATLDDRCAEGACDIKSGDAISPEGSTEDSGTTIDPCAENIAASECQDDTKALFVSSLSGDDSAPGSKAMPVRTLAGAFTKLSEKQRRIYVCDGTYAEDVVLDGSKNGVSLLGGVKCDDWTPSSDKPTFGNSTVALTISDAKNVTISKFEFIAKQATKPGDSSIAALVANASVTFTDISLTAGNGAPGEDGAIGTNWTGSAAVGPPPKGSVGGEGPTCTCADTTTKSVGGNGAASGGFATTGSAEPAVGTSNAGTSGPAACTVGLVGEDGAAQGAPGAAGAIAGTLTKDGWKSGSPGGKGGNGNPGQGGGGAGARTDTAFGGGAGGCGGCGGAGGTGGGNGGASFALALIDSNVALKNVALTSGKGGDGGKGGNGQDGQTGANGGNGICVGGTGGNGAGGSGGGGGAGGPSAAIAYTRAPGERTNVTPVFGSPGNGGKGGSAGAGAGKPGKSGTDGPQGSSGEMLSF